MNRQPPRHLVKAIMVGDARIRLDSTATFDEVRRMLGPATMAEPRDHDDSWKISYQLPDSKDARYVTFEFNEVGGASHMVLGVRLLRDAPSFSIQCLATTAHVERVASDNGVHIGMGRDSINSLMGGTPARMDATDDYEYHEIVGKPGDPGHHEIISSSIVTFRDDKAVEIQFWYADLGNSQAAR